MVSSNNDGNTLVVASDMHCSPINIPLLNKFSMLIQRLKASNASKMFCSVFAGEPTPNTVFHRLMHYDVKDDDMRKVFGRRLKFASNFIAYQVQESLDEKLGDDRRRLMRFLDGHGKPAAFLGWLFEACAHEMLLKGVDLPMRALNAHAKEISFKLDETAGIYTKFKMAELEQVFKDAHRQPDSSTLSSVDAHYLTKCGVLWLFQMTRNVDHKVNMEGVLELLERLGKLEDTDKPCFRCARGCCSHLPGATIQSAGCFSPRSLRQGGDGSCLQ